MRYVLLLFISFISFSFNAQSLKAEIGINGLTCSQCSKSVMKRIEKLDFVKKVDVDLDQTIAYVTFKSSNTDLWKTSKAVKDAGFSVRNFFLMVPNSLIQKEVISLGKDKIQIINPEFQSKNNIAKIELLGKHFSSKLDYNYERLPNLKGEKIYFGKLIE